MEADHRLCSKVVHDGAPGPSHSEKCLSFKPEQHFCSHISQLPSQLSAEGGSVWHRDLQSLWKNNKIAVFTLVGLLRTILPSTLLAFVQMSLLWYQTKIYTHVRYVPKIFFFNYIFRVEWGVQFCQQNNMSLTFFHKPQMCLTQKKLERPSLELFLPLRLFPLYKAWVCVQDLTEKTDDKIKQFDTVCPCVFDC